MFERFKLLRLQPTTIMYNALIAACGSMLRPRCFSHPSAREGRGTRAFELFNELKRRALQPDAATLVALLNACAQTVPVQRERAEKVGCHMRCIDSPCRSSAVRPVSKRRHCRCATPSSKCSRAATRPLTVWKSMMLCAGPTRPLRWSRGGGVPADVRQPDCVTMTLLVQASRVDLPALEHVLDETRVRS